MADPFIGEIRIFAGNFAPLNWAFCNGQTIPVSQNPGLFSLVGAIYGGDGRNDFGVPNLPGRAAMHAGSGAGLTSRSLGQTGGVETVTLTTNQVPGHTHQLRGSSARADEEGQKAPAGQYTARMQANQAIYIEGTNTNLGNMAAESMSAVGDGGAHTNLQPFLAINFIIALSGVFPTPN